MVGWGIGGGLRAAAEQAELNATEGRGRGSTRNVEPTLGSAQLHHTYQAAYDK